MLVEQEAGEVSVVVQCALLSVHRSGVYYAPRPLDERSLHIQRRIDEIYTACPFYSVRKITAQLWADGLLVNHKAVARHMQMMGLRAIYPGPNLSKRAQQHAVYPYLLRGLKANLDKWGLSRTVHRDRFARMWLDGGDCVTDGRCQWFSSPTPTLDCRAPLLDYSISGA